MNKQATTSTAKTDLRLDDNVLLSATGLMSCRHCGTELGQRSGPYLEKALRRERPPEAAGPQIRVRAEVFVDQVMVLRQRLCPGCYVVLQTEIVPVDEPEWRNRQIDPLFPK